VPELLPEDGSAVPVAPGLVSARRGCDDDVKGSGAHRGEVPDCVLQHQLVFDTLMLADGRTSLQVNSGCLCRLLVGCRWPRLGLLPEQLPGQVALLLVGVDGNPCLFSWCVRRACPAACALAHARCASAATGQPPAPTCGLGHQAMTTVRTSKRHPATFFLPAQAGGAWRRR
jgi:hypothetical protein